MQTGAACARHKLYVFPLSLWFGGTPLGTQLFTLCSQPLHPPAWPSTPHTSLKNLSKAFRILFLTSKAPCSLSQDQQAAALKCDHSQAWCRSPLRAPCLECWKEQADASLCMLHNPGYSSLPPPPPTSSPSLAFTLPCCCCLLLSPTLHLPPAFSQCYSLTHSCAIDSIPKSIRRIRGLSPLPTGIASDLPPPGPGKSTRAWLWLSTEMKGSHQEQQGSCHLS